MKFILLYLIFLPLIMTSDLTFAQQPGGGSDASGGGEYLKVKVRMGKRLAIEALRTIDESHLEHSNLSPQYLTIYTYIRQDLANDLSNSALNFHSLPEERVQFVINGVEKTAITKHKAAFPIEINLLKCEELQVTEIGAATLMMREGARHLGISDDATLDQIEEIGIIMVHQFLSQHPSFFIEQNMGSAISLNHIAAANQTFPASSSWARGIYLTPYDAMTYKGEVTYLYEDFFHYYTYPGNFDPQKEELIIQTMKSVESFFRDFGFMISFEYRGEFNQPPHEYPYSASWIYKDTYLKDTHNVISNNQNIYTSMSVDSTLNQNEYKNVKISFDLDINKKILLHPYLEKSYYHHATKYPCLCEVIIKTIFKNLSLNKLFPEFNESEFKTVEMDLKEDVNPLPHRHSELLSSFAPTQIQAIQEFLKTRVVIIQKPKTRLISDYTYYTIYETTDGLFLAFKPDLLSKIPKIHNLYLTLNLKESLFGIDSLWGDTRIFHTELPYPNGSFSELPMNSIFIALPNHNPDPMLTVISGGRLRILSLASYNPFISSHSYELKLIESSIDSEYDSPFDVHTFRLPALNFMEEQHE